MKCRSMEDFGYTSAMVLATKVKDAGQGGKGFRRSAHLQLGLLQPKHDGVKEKLCMLGVWQHFG